jgi:hypothetical protein
MAVTPEKPDSRKSLQWPPFWCTYLGLYNIKAMNNDHLSTTATKIWSPEGCRFTQVWLYVQKLNVSFLWHFWVCFWTLFDRILENFYLTKLSLFRSRIFIFIHRKQGIQNIPISRIHSKQKSIEEKSG